MINGDLCHVVQKEYVAPLTMVDDELKTIDGSLKDKDMTIYIFLENKIGSQELIVSNDRN